MSEPVPVQSDLMLSFRLVGWLHSIIRNLLLPDILMSKLFVWSLLGCKTPGGVLSEARGYKLVLEDLGPVDCGL